MTILRLRDLFIISVVPLIANFAIAVTELDANCNNLLSQSADVISDIASMTLDLQEQVATGKLNEMAAFAMRAEIDDKIHEVQKQSADENILDLVQQEVARRQGTASQRLSDKIKKTEALRNQESLAMNFRSLLKFRTGNAPVTSIDFSPDGTTIVTATNDGKVSIRATDSGAEIFHLNKSFSNKEIRDGRFDRVLLHGHSVAYSQDGSKIVVGTTDGYVVLFDAMTGEPIAHVNQFGNVNVARVKFSPDDTKILAATQLGEFRVLNTEGLAFIMGMGTRLDGTNQPTMMNFNHDGTRVIWPSVHSNNLDFYDISTKKKIDEETVHFPAPRDCAINRDGSQIATIAFFNGDFAYLGSIDQPADGKFKNLIGHKARITSIQFISFDHQLVTTSDDGTAIVWDAVSGRKLQTLVHSESNIPNLSRPILNAASYNSQTGLLATASADGTIVIWTREVNEP